MIKIEAFGVKIGVSKGRIGGFGPISGHLALLGPRLVVLGSRLELKSQDLLALGQRFRALGPKVGLWG